MTLSQLLGTVSELISSYFQIKKEKTSVAVKFTEMGMIAGQTAKTVGEKVTVVEKGCLMLLLQKKNSNLSF